MAAIHKKSFYETESTVQSGYYAMSIWDAFIDPKNETWICCPTCRNNVIPIAAHERIIYEKTITVISHFRLSKGKSCATYESDAHKNAKVLLANLIENKKISLLIGKSKINFAELKIKEVPKIPFRWEQTRHKRRADVLFEFSEWHNVLGQGIAFEIQTADLQEHKRIARETDWVCNGYSLSWLPISLFEETKLTKNEIIIQNVWALKFADIIQTLRNQLNELRKEFRSEMRQYEDRRTKTCRSCKHGSQSKKVENMIACWFGTLWGKGTANGTKKHPANHEALDSCTNWMAK